MNLYMYKQAGRTPFWARPACLLAVFIPARDENRFGKDES